MDLYHSFLLLLALSVLLTGGLAMVVLRRRTAPGAAALAAMLLGQAFWAVGHMCELLAAGLGPKILWDNLQFTGADILAMATFLFALYYTERQAAARRWGGALGALALLDALLVWSDPLHGLVRVAAHLDTGGAFPALEYGYGPWLWAFSAYVILLPSAALLLLILHAARLHPHYRLQAAAISIGVGFPLVGGLLTVTGVVPIAGMERLDISPITFVLGLPMLAWGVLGQRLLDIVPVARARLIEQMSDGLVVVDAQCRVVDINNRAMALLGASAGPPLGRPLAELIPQVGRLPGQRGGAHSQLIAIGPPGPGGATLELTITPLALRPGAADGWMLVLRDVTARHQAEQELQLARSRLEFLLERAPTVIFSATGRPDYRTTYISPNVLALTGYSAGAFTGRPGFWKEQIHPEDLGGFLAAVPQIAARGHGEHEYRFRCADGSYRWMQLRVQIVPGADGRPLELIGSWLDISAQKAHESRLRDLLASQEVLLKEVHHRVKNNLQVIISLLRLQAERLPPGEPKELLRDTQHRVRAMALVHEHLYGGVDLARLVFASYVRHLATMVLRSYAQRAGQVALTIDIPEDLHLTLDQAIPLGLILAELISNSLRHAFPEGRPGRLSIRISPEAGAATLTVSDDGVGLPAHLGSGGDRSLGLQLVHRLARQIRGELRASNSPGATFAIRFPLGESYLEKAAPPLATDDG